MPNNTYLHTPRPLFLRPTHAHSPAGPTFLSSALVRIPPPIPTIPLSILYPTRPSHFPPLPSNRTPPSPRQFPAHMLQFSILTMQLMPMQLMQKVHLLLVRLLHAFALALRGHVTVDRLGDAEGETDEAGDEAETC